MRLRTLFGAVLAVLALASSGPAAAQLNVFTGKPTMTIEQFGMPMSEQEAIERVTFRPFVPTPNYTEVALLPAFHGDDKDNPENRGIGYEFTEAGHTYVMREWPKAGGSLDRYPVIVVKGAVQCPDTHVILGSAVHPFGLGWTTQAFVFAIQPDPPNDTAPLQSEFIRLVHRGACR
jgi:hypothetical protein